MLDRIEDLVETKRQVSDNVAHDLRTQLRAWPEIIESTFERVKYRFTTEYLYHMLWW
jgi:hypothetical protein